MPRKYERKLGARSYRNYSEDALQEAVRKIKAKTISIRREAERYGIHRNTLWLKLHDKHKKQPGGQVALDEGEEKRFAAYTVAMATFGFPVTSQDLRCVVKAYLDRMGKTVTCFRNNLPGQDWAQSFLKRHKHFITQRTAKNITYSRAASDENVINQYFDNLAEELEGLPPSKIWNYDETNLSDDPGNTKDITKRGTKYPEQIRNSSKACTSLMFCGNAEGTTIPVYVNYKAERMHVEWTEAGPEDARYNRTPSGWFDHHIFEDWFMTTLLPVLKKQDGVKAIIGDNLSSHISLEVLRACEMNQIKFIALPPNSTHLLQPLDVAYFRPMKGKWRECLQIWKETQEGSRCVSVPKDQFPRLLKTLMDALVNGPQNLASGFRKTGIYPLNRNEVLNRLPSQIIRSETEVHGAASASFLEQLNAKRKEVTEKKVKRRTKVNVPPGKSISASDVKTVEVEPANAQSSAPEIDTDNPQPSTSAAVTSKQPVQRLKELNSRKKRKKTQPSSKDRAIESSSSSTTSEEVPYMESDDSTGIQFSEDDGSVPEENGNDQDNCSTQLKTSDFVIINYEGAFYPGKVTQMNEGRAHVSVMERCGLMYWKWPSQKDEIEYNFSDVIQKIAHPKQISKRGTFEVVEMKSFDPYLF